MSCSVNACVPDTTGSLRRLASSADASKIAVPVRSVARKDSSSASMTVWMCAASDRRPGKVSPIPSIAVSVSSCR